ncbi:MAG: glycosyltransferase family 8 protein [Muribaculaceae bacterium]|nr:glycosyltransferase family 8 protein [Muribaculaceae bacterium]
MVHHNNSIDIAFCVNNEYVKYMCVTIISILENNHENFINFHILTDYISKKNYKKIKEILDAHQNCCLKIYEVEDSILKGLKTLDWTIHAWYRILIPLILPKEINKILYLDADTLILNNLDNLFKINMQNKSVAGVMDIVNFKDINIFDKLGFINRDIYICSGVLLMNLEFWRSNDLTKRIIEWAHLNKNILKFPDQDSINIICKDSKIVLPLQYGILNEFFKWDIFYSDKLINQIKDCINNPIIVHYTCKPWHKDAEIHIYYSQWMYYNNKLKYPVKKSYCTKPSFLKLKIMIWNLFHPEGRQYVKLEDIKRKIYKIEKKMV